MGATTSSLVKTALMGDILEAQDAYVELNIEAIGSAAIERVEIRNRLEVLETYRPYPPNELGRRIRVIWEGSEYRGRGRQTVWDGHCAIEGNRVERMSQFNMWNLDKQVVLKNPQHLEWSALTTGGFGGFDIWLDDTQAGTLSIDTPLVKCKIAIADIGLEDMVFEAGGIKRQLRIFRLPDENHHHAVDISRRIKLNDHVDNALYVCLTQENGHLIWSSPIYVTR
jgi:hypothetical protein